MIKKGDIYLANVDSFSHKTKPVLIMQNNFLNRAVKEALYRDVTIMPLSTKLLGGDYRYLLKQRDHLQKDSEIVCNAITTVDFEILDIKKGVLTTLNNDEIADIEKILYKFFGLAQPLLF